MAEVLYYPLRARNKFYNDAGNGRRSEMNESVKWARRIQSSETNTPWAVEGSPKMPDRGKDRSTFERQDSTGIRT